jgi:hypothetical protein
MKGTQEETAESKVIALQEKNGVNFVGENG